MDTATLDLDDCALILAMRNDGTVFLKTDAPVEEVVVTLREIAHRMEVEG